MLGHAHRAITIRDLRQVTARRQTRPGAVKAVAQRPCLPFIGTEPSHILANIGMATDTDTDTEDRYLELCDALVERQGVPSRRSGGRAIWEADRFAGHPGFVQSDPIFHAAEDAGDIDPSGRVSTSGWRHLLQITEFEEGEELGTYICAPTDANGWRFSEAQVSTHHGG
jgi:hypothetical protein